MRQEFFRKNKLLIALGLALLAMTSPAWGQFTQGRVNVTVLDPQQAVVQGAVLELVDLATNEVRIGETQTAGTYSFINLPPGKYRLTISKPGFRNTVYDEVVVSATKATDIMTTLQVGSPTEVVTVEAAAPVVQTTQVAIGSVIDLKQIENLPLVGRDISRPVANRARLHGHVERPAVDRPGEQRRRRDQQHEPDEIQRQLRTD
jgi:hypothetical protein